MAAEKDAREEKKEAAPPKKSKLMFIIIAAVVVLVGGGAAGFFLMKKGSAPAAANNQADAHAAEPSGHGEGKGAIQTAFHGLDPFIVNLQDNSGTRYLKLTVNLELTSAAATGELNSQSARIRDSLIILLSSKSYADIGTVEGKYMMREEIVARVNQFITKGKVKTAYFTEFVIQ